MSHNGPFASIHIVSFLFLIVLFIKTSRMAMRSVLWVMLPSVSCLKLILKLTNFSIRSVSSDLCYLCSISLATTGMTSIVLCMQFQALEADKSDEWYAKKGRSKDAAQKAIILQHLSTSVSLNRKTNVISIPVIIPIASFAHCSLISMWKGIFRVMRW